MSESNEIQQVPEQNLSNQLNTYVVEKSGTSPFYIFATNLSRAREGASWFLGKNVGVLGAAKCAPPIGDKILVECFNSKDKPGHSGFVTRTFSK
jgi:hypothetical protein